MHICVYMYIWLKSNSQELRILSLLLKECDGLLSGWTLTIF